MGDSLPCGTLLGENSFVEVSWDLFTWAIFGATGGGARGRFFVPEPLRERDLLKFVGPFAVRELFAGTLGRMEICGNFVGPYICGTLVGAYVHLWWDSSSGKRCEGVSWDPTSAVTNLWLDPLGAKNQNFMGPSILEVDSWASYIW